MVSKTFVCLAVLALVAVCYCGPTERRYQKNQNQRPCDSSSQNDSSSDESNQQPCDLIEKQHQKQQQQQQKNHHQNKKNIRVQDTSSSESDENQRRVTIHMSQEDNKSKEMRYAPEHERVQGSHNNQHYLQQQQNKHNEQRSRHGKNEIESVDNVSDSEKNQLRKY